MIYGDVIYNDVSANYLIYIVWRAIGMMKIAGLNVIAHAFVVNGATNQKKFFRMHAIPEHTKSGITYKAPNLYDPGKFVYFAIVADVLN